MIERIDVVVIGAGQAGLAMSACLTDQSRAHVVLERARPAEAWRTRWDSFALNTLAGRSLNLPGLPFSGGDPERYPGRDEVVAYFDAYVRRMAPPLRLGVTTTAVRPTDGGRFVVETDHGALLADHVVVATGRHQIPTRPAFASALPEGVVQLHTSDYRNPGQLPRGKVLVVGSGQSSCQIVEELQASGRPVYLSLGGNGRTPIRYRGREFLAWIRDLDESWDHLAYGAQITGRDGGRSLNLHEFARDGMVLLGRLRGIDGRTLRFAPDLYERLAAADAYDVLARRVVDDHITANGLDYPEDPPSPVLCDGFAQPTQTELDVDATGITSVIWATGYRFDLSWIRLPILDNGGEPLQECGVTRVPGLYVLGFNLLRRPKSASLASVGTEAATIAEHIAGCSCRLGSPTHVRHDRSLKSHSSATPARYDRAVGRDAWMGRSRLRNTFAGEA